MLKDVCYGLELNSKCFPVRRTKNNVRSYVFVQLDLKQLGRTQAYKWWTCLNMSWYISLCSTLISPSQLTASFSCWLVKETLLEIL